MNDVNPDYVVVGETRNYNYAGIVAATRFIQAGAKLIATNPDLTGPGDGGMLLPACRALVAPIELATGCHAYYVGKPNPLMMRAGMRMLSATPEQTVIVGDRMDTDIIAGIESEIDTILVLTGVTDMTNIKLFPYRPKYICDGVGDIIREVE